MKDQIIGAVSSSEASTTRLKALGIPVFDSNAVEELSVYIDGADEIDHHGYMIKGGGAALTREKIVAAQSRIFVCIADESKRVKMLGDVCAAGRGDSDGGAPCDAPVRCHGGHGEAAR